MRRRGQIMVLGLFLLVPVTVLVVLILNVGLLMSHRQNLQNAADRAAASGALLQADLLSAIAWTNLALADLYAQAVPHAISTAMSATLAEIEDWGLSGFAIEKSSEANYWNANYNVPLSLPPPAALIGGSGAIDRYDEIYSLSGAQLSQYNLWRQQLESMQANIAALAGELIKREVFRTAQANFSNPDEPLSEDGEFSHPIYVNLFPFNPSYTPTGLASESWLITQTSKGGWRLEELSGKLVDISVDSEKNYKVTSHFDSFIEEYSVKFDGNLQLTVEEHVGGKLATVSLIWNPEIKGWKINDPSYSEETFVSLGAQGGLLIESKFGSEEVKRDPLTGVLERWNGSQWVPAPIDYEISKSITVPVESNAIQIGSLVFTLTHDAHLITWLSNLQLHLDPVKQNIRAQGFLSGLTKINFRADGQLSINDWQVPQDATGQWRITDNLRDRLSTQGSSQWVYEIASHGAYTAQETNYTRFGLDQSQGLFGSLFGTEGKESKWLNWFDVSQGNVKSLDTDSDDTYHQTLTCWHPYDITCPVHLTSCPGQTGHTDHFSSQADGGWHHPGGIDADNVTVPGTDWVICYLCEQTDYNGDGTSDIRRFLADNLNTPEYPVSNSRLRSEGDPTNWRINLPSHLTLTEDFFRWGINVAVHSRPHNNLLLKSFFDSLHWSPIATASARIGFVDPETEELIYRFDSIVEREDWVNYSKWNLTATEWVASMVSTKSQIDLEDLELEDSWLTSFPETDSGAVALLKYFLESDPKQRSQWRQQWDAPHPTQDLLTPFKNRQGEIGDFTDPSIEKWIKH